jgi:hypothetical protein
MHLQIMYEILFASQELQTQQCCEIQRLYATTLM